ncbi:outer membrane beta-barrel protein [Bdellovibrionota bacterium FG-2]
MKQKIITAGIMAILSITAAQPAHALELGVVGGLNHTNSTPTPATFTFGAGNSYALGAFFDYGLATGIGMEIGAFLANRKLTASTTLTINGVSQTFSGDMSYNTYQFPLLLRFTALPFLSFGAGGYYAMGTGNVTETVGGVPLPVPATFAEVGLKTSDYGLEGNARFRLPILPLFGLIVDARYLYGLADTSASPDVKLNTRDFQALAGIQFGF